MAGEGPYRHPGGRTCAGVMLMLTATLTAASGLMLGVFWAAIR